MFIQINIGFIQALRYNQMNNVRLNKVMEQLSSGLRINRAVDDISLIQTAKVHYLVLKTT